MKLPSKIVMAIVVACGSYVGENVANAATLADWQRAAQSKGCDSIPYNNLQQNCASKQREVDDNCTKKYSCDELDPRGRQKNIESLQNKIADLDRKRADISRLRDELARKLSAASDDSEKRNLEDLMRRAGYEDESAKNEIYEYNKKIDEWKRTLEDEMNKINDRLYYGKRCVTARVEVQKIFGDVYSTAERESDPAIAANVGNRLRYWQDEFKSHGEELGRAQTAVEKCIRMRE